MPGLVVHIQLCDRLRSAATVRGPDLLAGPLDAADWNALAAGSVLPDMGYYPGGDPFLTDLAHYVRSAELGRAILGRARDRTGELFALGWLSHVLADALFHPVVNAATAEVRGETGARTYEEAPGDHARVELGWDAWALARSGDPDRYRIRPALAGRLGETLSEAYRAVYGLQVPAGDLARSERAMLRSRRSVLAVQGAVGRSFTGRRLRGVDRLVLYGLVRPVGALASFLARRSALWGLTHPVRPSDGMLAAIDAAGSRFVSEFLDHLGDGFARLPDYNLDTGAVAGIEPYAARDRTLERLTHRRAADDIIQG